MDANQLWEKIKVETHAFISTHDQRPGMCNQNEAELLQMLDRLLQLSPRHNMLEIGFSGGGSFLVWTRLFDKVATVEMSDGCYREFFRTYRDFENNPNYRFILGLSQDDATLQAVQEFSPVYDALFIDGSHRYEHVSADYKLYAPLVRPGGMIIFHDACHLFPNPPSGVPQFLSELREQGHDIEVICATIEPSTPWQNLVFGHMGVGIEIKPAA